MEADDNDEPTWLVVIVVVSCFKKKEKKDNKNPPCLAIASEGVGCRRCRGCRRRQTTTTSLHGSSSSLAFVDLKKKMIKTHPVSQLQARGWVVDVVVGADGGRRRQ